MGKGKDKKSKKAKSKKKSPYTAATADKYVLYQLSVQAPDHEVEFIDEVFRKRRKRIATSLREDFCGTALLCSEWVKSGSARSAVGIDIDPEPLEWGSENNIAPLGDAASRVSLLQENVLNVHEGNFDVAVGFNFSYWLFQKRQQMRHYFEVVRSSLCDDGIFFLDFYGGWQAEEPMEEPRDVEGKFEYVWDQADYNPIDSSAQNYIHFRFKDGTEMERAFEYEWRLWTIIEIRELLEEAGFRRSLVYWEEEDENGDETGEYSPREEAENHPGWLAYIIAEK